MYVGYYDIRLEAGGSARDDRGAWRGRLFVVCCYVVVSLWFNSFVARVLVAFGEYSYCSGTMAISYYLLPVVTSCMLYAVTYVTIVLVVCCYLCIVTTLCMNNVFTCVLAACCYLCIVSCLLEMIRGLARQGPFRS